MNEQQTLIDKREETQREILAFKERTPTTILLDVFDRWFPKSIPEHSFIYWLLQIILINAIIILPSYLLSLAFDDVKQWASDSRTWVVALELAVYAFLISHTAYRLMYNRIARHIVNKITNSDDLTALTSFLKPSTVAIYSSLVLGGVLWSAWTLVIKEEYRIVGLIYMVFLVGCLIGVSFQTNFVGMGLANQLKYLRYELNTFTPANSEIVTKLSDMLNTIIYLTGAFFVVLTLFVSSGFFGSLINKALAVPLTLLGWGTILIQFFIHRSTINEIVSRERWTSLNKLQLQMNTIQATEDLSNKDVSERLLRLADLHERIRSDRSGGFDLKSVLGLFSQLMLPLLGLLLGNIKNIMELLK